MASLDEEDLASIGAIVAKILKKEIDAVEFEYDDESGQAVGLAVPDTIMENVVESVAEPKIGEGAKKLPADVAASAVSSTDTNHQLEFCKAVANDYPKNFLGGIKNPKGTCKYAHENGGLVMVANANRVCPDCKWKVDYQSFAYQNKQKVDAFPHKMCTVGDLSKPWFFLIMKQKMAALPNESGIKGMAKSFTTEIKDTVVDLTKFGIIVGTSQLTAPVREAQAGLAQTQNQLLANQEQFNTDMQTSIKTGTENVANSMPTVPATTTTPTTTVGGESVATCPTCGTLNAMGEGHCSTCGMTLG